MRFTLALIFFFTSKILFSQHHDLSEKPIMWKGKQHQTQDSSSLLHAFKTGIVHGHFRHFTSTTINKGALSDYYANAIGGGIRYETNSFHHFQFAVSGFYFFNIGSSDMAALDPITNQGNRYEIGLFDLEHPGNKKDMDRLEELYLKYNGKKGHVIFGRQLINTPLINLQDGRMRGTGVEGLWFDFTPTAKLVFQGGFLYAISPRSTTKWYGVGESIGLYPQGIATNGVRADYLGKVHSKGIGVLSAKYLPVKGLELQVWDYFVDNVFNVVFSQAQYTKPIKSGDKLIVGAQFIRQDAVVSRQPQNVAFQYIEKDAKAMTYGAKIALKHKNWEYSLNYNRITNHNRFLFPREWGRDPFFTFMPRERTEGFANVQAFVGKVDWTAKNKLFKVNLASGYVNNPDVLNFEQNKYGIPSYAQVNLDLRYNFKNIIQGLEAQLLLVAKFGLGDTYGNMRYEFNKVNMMLGNLVLNYHF
jgi:hypothetical protein